MDVVWTVGVLLELNRNNLDRNNNMVNVFIYYYVCVTDEKFGHPRTVTNG
jgi:hypothetical protein